MNNINFRAPLGVLLLAAAIAACDNPVSPREEHSEPDGLVLRAGATELIRVDEEGVTGTLTAVVAVEGPELTVTYIDHDGDAIALDPAEYWVEVNSASPATATWQASAADGFRGRVTGHAAGTTTLTFVLHHGPAGGGHPEEGGSYDVPVTVTATQQ